MPFEHDYTDSARAGNPEQCVNDEARSRRESLARKAEYLPLSESLIDYDDQIGGDA